jgi:hypothetical protein
MVIGGVIGGVGFGASFSGALRSVAPLAGRINWRACLPRCTSWATYRSAFR